MTSTIRFYFAYSFIKVPKFLPAISAVIHERFLHFPTRLLPVQFKLPSERKIDQYKIERRTSDYLLESKFVEKTNEAIAQRRQHFVMV